MVSKSKKKVAGKRSVEKVVEEDTSFEVTKYVVLENIFLSTGIVVLKGYEQLKKQVRGCKCINQKDGVFEIEKKICFKKDEVFEFGGRLPRVMEVKLSTDVKDIKIAENRRDSRDAKQDKVNATSEEVSKQMQINREEKATNNKVKKFGKEEN